MVCVFFSVHSFLIDDVYLIRYVHPEIQVTNLLKKDLIADFVGITDVIL